MVAEPLGQMVCDPVRMARIIEATALRTGDPDAHDLMFSRLYDDRIDTPASAPDAEQVSFCTGKAGMFDDLELFVDGPVDALFDIDTVITWLRWLGGEAEPATITFEGDPATGVTSTLVHECTSTEVVIPAKTDWRLGEIDLSLPDRFRGGQFLDRSGEPMPTTVDVGVDELERLVAATNMSRPEDEYEIVIEDEALCLSPDPADGVRVSGVLDADVDGPDVSTTVGPGFERVVSSLEGDVQLQTGRNEPLAIVKDRETFTLRFVVYP